MPDDSRYERGRAKLKQMLGTTGEEAIESIAGISPDMARYVLEFIFGDIHTRPGLDLKMREIAAVASLVTRGSAEPQLRAHLHGALNVGCSEQEIIELMIEMAVYAGFPAALNGLFAARDVFAERAAKPATKNNQKSRQSPRTEL
jgi:4-carboxymuconolactone decarboxylase